MNNLTVISATCGDHIDPRNEKIVMVGPSKEVMARYREMCEANITPIGYPILWHRGISQRATGTGWV